MQGGADQCAEPYYAWSHMLYVGISCGRRRVPGSSTEGSSITEREHVQFWLFLAATAAVDVARLK